MSLGRGQLLFRFEEMKQWWQYLKYMSSLQNEENDENNLSLQLLRNTKRFLR